MKKIKLLPKQEEFIFSESKFCGFGGGWGNGKTLAGIIKTIRSCEEPNNLFLVGRKNYTDLRDSTMRDFMAWFPEIPINKMDAIMKLPNGSEILFRHVDMLHSLTNLNLGGFWIDQAEEIDEDVFVFLIGRLRRENISKLQGFITFNMEGHNWIWKRFKQRPTPDYHLIEATSLENPHLPKGYIRTLLAEPDSVKKRYIYGSWDVAEGQVWPMWNEKIHVIEPFKIPAEGIEYLVIDHGLTNPTAIGKFAIDCDGNVYLTDEHYESGQLVSYHAAIAKQMMGNKELDIYIDPSCNAKSGIGGISVIDEYMLNGICAVPADNSVLAGINRVGEYLKIDENRFHPLTRQKGSPRFFIFANCVNAIREIAEYRWEKPKYSNEENGKERPTKRNDHMCDVIRYALMQADYKFADSDDIDEDEDKDLYFDYKGKAGFTGYIPLRRIESKYG
jgi:phage terminase large subunit